MSQPETETGKTYHVHLYTVVRTRINSVPGNTMAEACENAVKEYGEEIRSMVDKINHYPPEPGEWEKCPPGIAHMEDAEEICGALVDVPGDEDYEHSTWMREGREGWTEDYGKQWSASGDPVFDTQEILNWISTLKGNRLPFSRANLKKLVTDPEFGIEAMQRKRKL